MMSRAAARGAPHTARASGAAQARASARPHRSRRAPRSTDATSFPSGSATGAPALRSADTAARGRLARRRRRPYAQRDPSRTPATPVRDARLRPDRDCVGRSPPADSLARFCRSDSRATRGWRPAASGPHRDRRKTCSRADCAMQAARRASRRRPASRPSLRACAPARPCRARPRECWRPPARPRPHRHPPEAARASRSACRPAPAPPAHRAVGHAAACARPEARPARRRRTAPRRPPPRPPDPRLERVATRRSRAPRAAHPCAESHPRRR